MNRSKSFGKKDRPLEKGQQTLAAFFSKSASIKTLSKCPSCLKQISTPKLAVHQQKCSSAVQNRSFKEDSDSDIEIIEDTKTPAKKSATSALNSSQTCASGKDGITDSSKKTPECKRLTKGPSLGSAASTAGTSASVSNGASGSNRTASNSPSAASGPAKATVESSHSTTTPGSVTPAKDDIPPWGRGSPVISDIMGGGIAAAFCEATLDLSSVSGTTSEPNTPGARRGGPGAGGWLVSPTRSPSVSPSGRVLPSPAGGPLTSSPAGSPSLAGRLAPPGAQVRLSPAVAGRMGRFAHSGLLAEHLSSPNGTAQNRSRNGSPLQPRAQCADNITNTSPSKRSGRSESKSPGRGKGSTSGEGSFKSPGVSPAQSPSRRLPKTNPVRYLSSPSSARRRLYRSSSGEVLQTTTSAASPNAKLTVGHKEPVAGKTGDAQSPTKRGENVASDTSAKKVTGLVKLADVGMLRCDSQERLIENFPVTLGIPSAPPASVSDEGYRRDPVSDLTVPSVPTVTVEDSNSSSTMTSIYASTSTRCSTAADTADADVDLNMSAEDEELLSQEFSTEMVEVALLSPSKSDSSQPYYLQNFLFIIDSVLADELHGLLLNDEDLDVIASFRTLPSRAQMLYVRMFQRKHAWLRSEKLRYTEVGDEAAVAKALDQLTSAGLVESESQLNGVMELAELLPAPELKQLCQQLHLATTGPRPELLARLSQLKKRSAVMFGAASPAEMAARRARTLLGRCARVSAGPRRVLLRVLSLFHLPLYEDDEDTSQQLLTLLMVNLGRMVYPPVTVSKQTRIFPSRDDLLRYEAASQLERQLRSAMENKQWETAYEVFQSAETMRASLSELPHLAEYDASLPPFLRRFTAGSIVTYVLSKGVEVLQRRREHEAAVTLLRSLLGQRTYLPDYRGFWWDRLALTLHQHVRRPDEALQAARSALEDPEVRGGRHLALQQRVARLEPDVERGVLQPDHLPSVEIEARSLPRDVPGLKMVFLRPDGAGGGGADAGDVTVCSVEELALSHYSSRYSEGVHREGAPTVTLFALLFWDLLYAADVPDSFRSAYQTLPLDLNSAAFLERRRDAVQARLTELETGTEEEACRRAAAVWHAHNGCLSLASWDVFRDCEHALGLVRCLGVRLLTAICRRLASEYRFTRSGFPDLVLWNPSDRTARIVEVKGPNDRLSTKQMLWIQYLLEHGASAEVCYVRALGRRGGGGKRKAEGAVGAQKQARSPRKRRAAAPPTPAAAAGAGDDVGEGDNDPVGGTKRKRGRPRKTPAAQGAEVSNKAETVTNGTQTAGSGEGASGKTRATRARAGENDTGAGEASQTGKRRGGRPRKKRAEEKVQDVEVVEVDDSDAAEASTQKVGTARGTRSQSRKTKLQTLPRGNFPSAEDSSDSDFT